MQHVTSMLILHQLMVFKCIFNRHCFETCSIGDHNIQFENKSYWQYLIDEQRVGGNKVTKSHSFAYAKAQEKNHKTVVFEHYLVTIKAGF